MSYIEREAVLRAYDEVQRRNGPWRFESLIESVPSADVEPVRYGLWKSDGLSSLKCSVCGFVDDHKMYYKNCPECRAKMR